MAGLPVVSAKFSALTCSLTTEPPFEIEIEIDNLGDEALFLNETHPLVNQYWNINNFVKGPRLVLYRPGTSAEDSELVWVLDICRASDLERRKALEKEEKVHRERNFSEIPSRYRYKKSVVINGQGGCLGHWYDDDKMQTEQEYNLAVLQDPRFLNPNYQTHADEIAPIRVQEASKSDPDRRKLVLTTKEARRKWFNF